jgi:hypothetical protein
MSLICKEFHNTSEYIYNWYSKQINVNEESLTDWFLYNLSVKLTTFKYISFTKKQENKLSGADFDFWIINQGQNISLRIQAKKLLQSGDHYDKISYPKKKSVVKQIDTLINSTTTPFQPFYLFYNNNMANNKCSKINCGTLLIDAKELKRNFLTGKKVHVSRQNLVDLSIPLECLFCCPLSQQGGDNLFNLKSFFKEYFPTNNISKGSEFNDIIPNYIKDLLDRDYSQQQWLEMYQKQFEDDIRCIAVLDLREIKNDFI